MAIITIEIPEKVEKTLCDLIVLLGGRVIITDSNVKSEKGKNKNNFLSRSDETVEFKHQHTHSEIIADINLEAIVFMKFGYHAKQNIDDIIKRKKLEFEKAGMMFWGYGGSVCHPEKQVQQFVKNMHLKGKKVFLAMSFTKSKPGMDNKSSSRYSADKLKWTDVPEGIEVTGSKHAIVCSELLECDISLNLNDYEIAIGSKIGKEASSYIKGQNDKGCLIKSDHKLPDTNQFNNSSKVKISLLAEIINPYAVFMV